MGEIDVLYKRCKLVLEFFILKSNDSTGFNIFIDGLEESYVKGDIRGLRITSRELDVWSKELSEPDYKELKNLLKDELDIDLDDEDKKKLKKIRSIIAKGKISTNTEFRLLLNFVDNNFDDPSLVDDIDKIKKLLIDYEK